MTTTMTMTIGHASEVRESEHDFGSIIGVCWIISEVEVTEENEVVTFLWLSAIKSIGSMALARL